MHGTVWCTSQKVHCNKLNKHILASHMLATAQPKTEACQVILSVWFTTEWSSNHAIIRSPFFKISDVIVSETGEKNIPVEN